MIQYAVDELRSWRMSPSPTPSYGWLIGRVSGIPVYIAGSWGVIAAVIVLTFGPRTGLGTTGYFVAAAYALLLLVSVLVHEAGHAIAARALGGRVDRIVANLWGGHTVFGGAHEGPRTSGIVAIAGPVGNLALALLGWWGSAVLTAPIPSLLAGALAYSNLLVAAFNLLPGLPLDGGFLVEAAVWGLTGSRGRGMLVAGWAGRLITAGVAGWLAVVQPLLTRTAPDLLSLVWVALIGAFLWRGASAAIAVGRTRVAVEALRVGQLLRPVVVVPAHASAQTVVDGLLRVPEAASAVVVDPAGMPVGWVDLAALASAPEASLPSAPATAFLATGAPGWVVTADPADSAGAVVQALAGNGVDHPGHAMVLVRDAGGSIAGSVSLEDTEAALVRR
jgi:Zn-dependent protease